MSLRMLLPCFLLFSSGVLADAADGQFMGYQLGERYAGPASQQVLTTTGNLLVTADKPVKPDDIAEVALLATRETLTIGFISASQWFATEDEAREFGRRYFELLRAKYPDWPYGWEVMDAELNVIEVNLNNDPHNLRLSLAKDTHQGEPMWRFSMTLGWLPDSPEESKWRELSLEEQVAAKLGNRQQLLEDSDTRGL